MINKKYQLVKKYTTHCISTLVMGMFFVFVTNPSSMPIALVLTIPLLVAIFCLSSTKLLMVVFTDMTSEKIEIIARSIAMGVLFLLALGSIKQLMAKDLLLIALLFCGVAFYFIRAVKSPETS